MRNENIISGKLVDVDKRQTYPVEMTIGQGRILKINEVLSADDVFIIPALVDSHIHIESSMLTPQNFTEIALRHGTVATVSDPHEIANVMGMDGIRYMIDNAAGSPLKFYFGAPGCVPATDYETSGAKISAKDIEELFIHYDLKFLSEMMNFPGVISGDDAVAEKIKMAGRYGKKIDGHAPGLKGESLQKYIDAGIETDHECSGYEEALEKINRGMKIQIREGSAARNFEKLYPLIDQFPEKVMLCSDDLHPDDLMHGHMNVLLKKAVAKGLNLYNVLRAVNQNPVMHYGLDVGMLREGDPADFILVNNLKDFEIVATYIDGNPVYKNKQLHYKSNVQEIVNNFYSNIPEPEKLIIKDKGKKINIIEAIDGEITTNKRTEKGTVRNGQLVADPEKDLLKIVVQNRYEREDPSVGFISGFGLTNGALASSIAHDSHNIIVVSTHDEYIPELISWINDNKGGIAFHDGKEIMGLPLKIAGIISDQKADYTAKTYAELDKAVKKSGCKLQAPFMTLSFMSLQVIPELKMSNKGLFDVNAFKFTSVYDEG